MSDDKVRPLRPVPTPMKQLSYVDTPPQHVTVHPDGSLSWVIETLDAKRQQLIVDFEPRTGLVSVWLKGHAQTVIVRGG